MMPQINKTLNPDLWIDDKLKPEVRDHLLKIATTFYDTLKIKENPTDITLTGSSANYNYTKSSDIDLHILLPFTEVTCDQEITKDYFLAKKSLWNNDRNITLFNREVELYVQDTKEHHNSTGVYSVLRDYWVLKPKQINLDDIDIDEKIIDKKYKEYVSIINHNISKDSNYDYLKKIKNKIVEERRKGLSEAGEYSSENVVFKKLRADGFLDKLSNFLKDVEDEKLSLESFKKFFSKRVGQEFS